nr:hypothetical protein [Tanacetum cinerariifolium]
MRRSEAEFVSLLGEIGGMEIDGDSDSCIWSLSHNGDFLISNAKKHIDDCMLPNLLPFTRCGGVQYPYFLFCDTDKTFVVWRLVRAWSDSKILILSLVRIWILGFCLGVLLRIRKIALMSFLLLLVECFGMVLTNTPFIGSNFHGWSRNARMALGAKLKLRFIDGSCVKLDVGDVELQRWRCDYMVTCWILNFMAKKQGRIAAHVNSGFDEHFTKESPFDMRAENEVAMNSNGGYDQKLVVVVCQEVMKMFKGKGIAYEGNVGPSYAGIWSSCTASFALFCHPNMNIRIDWVTDTRDSDRMTPNFILFIIVTYLKNPIIVNLHDATYLINKMLVKILDWKTPFEKLYGKPPTYDHLRVIGCLCNVAVTKPHKDKLDDKGIKYVLLGYPTNQKGYKLYNWESNKVLLSKDVIFKENEFPFKHPSPSVFSKSPYSLSTIETNPLNDTESVKPNTPLSDNNFIPTASSIPTPTPVLNVPTPTQNTTIPLIRKSNRQPTRFVWLKDFVTQKVGHSNYVSSQYLIFGSSDFKGIPYDHIAFLATVFAITEPTSYKQASKEEGWIKAMNVELATLEKNEKWILTTLPPCHKAITSKWVYKNKYLPAGIVDKLKARLVVNGFNRKEGLDYKHTFSPVAKLATVRVLVSLATVKECPLHQLDVNNAFLHGYIDEEIYMLPPKGYHKALPGQ